MCPVLDCNIFPFLGDGSIITTITWLNWMPHVRILNVDTDLLLQLIVNNINIDRFSSLEVLIVRQTKNCTIAEPLAIVTRAGASSSMRTVHLQHYRANSQFTTNDSLLAIHQICQNMCRLKVMTIEFSTDGLFNSETLEKVTEIQKKNCRLEYIHVSNVYIELWFDQ